MIRELDVALNLARRAGDEIMHVLAGEFDVVDKTGNEGPVTVADHRADELIRRGLADAFPDDALLTEETPDDLVRMRSERVWIVDPLDGTRQFVQRETEFAVMIGLAVAGRAILGVVHLPCENLTYIAAQGEGAHEVDAAGRARKLALDPLPEAGRLVVTISRSHYGTRTRRVVEAMNPTEVVMSGSVGRKAALVAAGRADVYITLGSHSRHWDACAPDAIVREAGGSFRDCRAREILYNTEKTRNAAGLLACRRGLLESVAAAVEATLGPETPP